MPTPGQNAAGQERRVKEKWEAAGYQALRSAGSRGLVDLVAWNEKEINFLPCQKKSFPWHPNKMRMILDELKRPPNSHVYFYQGMTLIDEERARAMISAYQTKSSIHDLKASPRHF